MARSLELSDEAVDDLTEIIGWQTQPGSGQAARRRVQRIRVAIMRLKRDPCLFPVGDRPGIREMATEAGHRVLYTVVPDTGRSSTSGNVYILRIFGPGQQREAALQDCS